MIAQDNLFGLLQTHVEEFEPGHYLHKDTASALRLLQYVASEQDIDCQLVSSFRPFTRQLAIWERKWRGEAPLYAVDGTLLDHNALSDWQKIEAILTWSALPGASRHHWGTDVDVYDKARVQAEGGRFELIEAEYSGNGPCADLATFLSKEASKYGFTLPYSHYTGGVAKEPWHLSYSAIADDYAAQFQPDALFALLQNTGLSGKTLVLKRFDEIIHRFVFNRGINNE